MKVKELINHLQAFNSEAEVVYQKPYSDTSDYFEVTKLPQEDDEAEEILDGKPKEYLTKKEYRYNKFSLEKVTVVHFNVEELFDDYISNQDRQSNW